MRPVSLVQGGNVTNPTLSNANAPQIADLTWTLGLTAVLWTASDAGYHFLLPALGLRDSYNVSSVAIALYYAIWVLIAITTFWSVYRTWWTGYENRLTTYILFIVGFAALALFPGYALPLLPPINWAEPWTPPEVVFATPWYFLPKSIEILFQQLLIAAVVVAFSGRQYRLWIISVCCAILFGGTHVLLAFEDLPLGYVIRLVVAGAVFGFVFPYLILRVRNGLAYSYITHWGYYAMTVLMAHIFYTPNATPGPGL